MGDKKASLVSDTKKFVFSSSSNHYGIGGVAYKIEIS